MKKFVLTLALFLVAVKAEALELRLGTVSLNAHESHKAREVLAAVTNDIPEPIKQALPVTLKVEFTPVDADSDKVHLGRASYYNKTISLNQRFLADSQDAVFSEERLKKTLVHEIAHFYDRATQFSDYEDFKALTQWLHENSFQRRLPDLYMHDRPNEVFPTSLELFLYDADFACREPALNTYYSKHFGARGNLNCGDTMSWYLSSSNSGPEFKDIRKSQIWSIDFLWASEGKGLGSQFGHGLLRLVVCAPDRVPGPDCYRDFNHHIILSFAATSATGEFASVDGLMGSYPMNLYAMTFASIKYSYNMTELRDIYAVPLRLDGVQKSLLIDHLYAQNWNLNGRYYFLTRNCSTEVSRALVASGLFPQSSMITTNPRTFLDHILRSNLSTVNSREEIAKNPLLFFKSSQDVVDRALELVMHATGLKLKDLEDYFDKVDAKVLRQTVEREARNSRLLYSFYYLEGIRIARLKAKLSMKAFEENSILKDDADKVMAEQAKLLFSFRFPGSFLSRNHYGLPTPLEIEQVKVLIADKFKDDRENVSKQAAEGFVSKFGPSAPPQLVILVQRQNWILNKAQEAEKR